MNVITSAIKDFRDNIPTHLQYQSIKEYNFIEKDKSDIEKYINSFPESFVDDSNIEYISLVRNFIGVLVCDQVNASAKGRYPILDYDWD